MTVRDQIDLIALAPCILGYHPNDDDCVVFLGLSETEGASIAVHVGSGSLHRALPLLRRVVRERTFTLTALIAYGPETVVGPVLLQMLHAFHDDAADVDQALRVEGLRVEGRRWWCVLPGCDAPDHPHRAGRILDLSSSRVAAAAESAGLVVYASRADKARAEEPMTNEPTVLRLLRRFLALATRDRDTR
ncbi:DUF4192 family protein [Actinomadura atramentaria]|uniref:DUF4192 family protein n=1 Tax=Actinomadura atramentaria TaxID=1990 RepID=UPI00035DE1BB|nr:DUF4192 family protein [Actinomadura atramentaria]